MKPIHALQHRLTGPTEGTRVLRHIQGMQRWRLLIWLTFPDTGHEERDILVSAPVPMSALLPLYQQHAFEICTRPDGQSVVATAGGFDAWVLPKHAQPKPIPRKAKENRRA